MVITQIVYKVMQSQTRISGTIKAKVVGIYTNAETAIVVADELFNRINSGNQVADIYVLKVTTSTEQVY